ncbi:zinc knuckle CX2CX4HX4C containing protein [Tanacetum coccineum]
MGEASRAGDIRVSDGGDKRDRLNVGFFANVLNSNKEIETNGESYSRPKLSSSSFSSLLHEKTSKQKNTLYGDFIGKKVAFSLVERCMLNSWKKFGVERIMGDKMGVVFIKFSSTNGLEGVLEHGSWLIRSVPLILRKWISTAELLPDELTFVLVRVKLHGVLALAFTIDCLSDISTRLGTLMMLDSYTTTACT